MTPGIQPPVPVDEIVKRPMQFFWLADYSGSMSGRKIASLNQSIREALPAVRSAVASHPEVQIMMRAIKFADTASWHVGPDPVPLEQFLWPELTTDGVTATAEAIRLLAAQLDTEHMPRRGYPPVCILISDGFCTDPAEEYDSAIAELESLPWGIKAVRLAVAIGDSADYDENELLKFVSHKSEVGVLKADTPEKLVEFIRWASVAASIGASQAKSKSGNVAGDESNVVMPTPAPVISKSTDPF